MRKALYWGPKITPEVVPNVAQSTPHAKISQKAKQAVWTGPARAALRPRSSVPC